MSQESPLRFSVEESVWFQKGQEVSELLSISLDPDIAIYEHDQYISIRGALKLHGEYKIDEEQDGAEESFEYSHYRYVNEVSTREDGISILSHRFPVDITIPKNRISNLDDVYVMIESFDYEIPEQKCIKLVADLSICGISDQEAERVDEDQEMQSIKLEEEIEEEIEDNEPVEAAEEELEALYRGPQALAYEEEKLVDEEEEKLEEKTYSNAAIESPYEDESVQEHVYEPFEVEVRKQILEEKEEKDQEPEVHYSSHFYSEPKQDKAEKEGREEQEEIVSKKESDNSLYLTKLFERENEEEFSKLKICIAQQGDTVHTICERYDITLQQLSRVNQFGADQDVYEGQIVYIPAYVGS
ncbi:stage VI sporulation protein D [Metabacillus arenae]|uniref:Stage VI sporulation protein D n=1 Tax=Metabacillus arenae TaxID=2771434 RepID=A0A926NGL8_9BACI|nr:stage VI sporulation protein D [Metabacillus arenae]MBD1381189.1 stage VI sporulation protein D [Metabacillus arenae]